MIDDKFVLDLEDMLEQLLEYNSRKENQ